MDKKENIFPELMPFEYQVAGHSAKNLSGNIDILKHKDGYILKPINKSPQGDTEIAFYERLNSDKDLLFLKKFIPTYLGFLNLKYNNVDMRFLKLKDVTNGISKPCVMDIKIGKQTWDPNATIEKRIAEDKKYADCKREYGFCIPGYVVFNTLTGKFDKFGREDGKKLGKDTTLDAFKHFFNYSCGHSSGIILHMVNILGELLNWWNTQRIVHMFASSVLLTYDASKLEEIIANSTTIPPEDFSKWVKIHMIDFAHVYPAEGRKDCNYVSGLSKLREVLKLMI